MSKDNGVLSPLVGRKGAKAVIRKALRAGDVHLCFTGPPECGKSVALTAIEDAFDGAVYRDSSDVTKSKLKDILADDPPVLLLEEIDDMSYDAAKALSTALEQGRVTKTNQRKSYDEDISTQVFAAANEFSSLPGHIQTRFGDIHFPQYDRDEFIEVCGELLPRSVSWIDGPEAGRAAAEAVAEQRGRLSVRAAKRICTLSSSLSDVPAVSRALEDAEADVNSQPITADELHRKAHTNKEQLPEYQDMTKTVAEMSDSELLDMVDHCRNVLAEVDKRGISEEDRQSSGESESKELAVENINIMWQGEFMEAMEQPEDPMTGDKMPHTHIQDAFEIHWEKEMHEEIAKVQAELYNTDLDNLAFYPDGSSLPEYDAMKAYDLKRDDGNEAFRHRRFKPSELIQRLDSISEDGILVRILAKPIQ